MRLLVPVIAVVLVITCQARAASNSTSLVQIDSKDYGYTNAVMRLVEIERNEKTSKIRLTYEKLGSSVGSSMFIARAFYEVAKARGAEYFINLKEWEDGKGVRIFIAGFTNTKDADLKKEFGDEYSYENEYAQKRGYMSVSQLKMVFERQQKSIEPSAPANGASPRR